MLRLTAIFIAICVVLIAASLGAVGYLVFGLTVAEASIVALTAMTALALYNTVTVAAARSQRRRRTDRRPVARHRRSRPPGRRTRPPGDCGRDIRKPPGAPAAPNDPLAAEIGELGVLVKQLAETVATHDARLADLQAAPAALAPAPIDRRPPPSLPASRHRFRAEPVAAVPVAAGAGRGRSSRLRRPNCRPPVRSRARAPTRSRPSCKSAIDNNRIDLYLQPVVTLPQRKVRYYEAMTRLRTEDGTLILPSDFLAHAEKSGLIPRIDNVQLFRCVQVLRRLLLKNREIGLFCNVSVATLNDRRHLSGSFSIFWKPIARSVRR